MDASMARAARNINPMFSDPGWQLFGTGDPYERSAGCYSNVITDAESCPTFMDNRILDPLPLPLTSSRVLPTISAYHPTIRAVNPPKPYKPSVTDCFTGPNDAAERMLENSVPIEHDPAATALVYQSTSRGNNPVVSPETIEGANAATVIFAGFVNWFGCMANAF
jgi:hypothetical protein